MRFCLWAGLNPPVNYSQKALDWIDFISLSEKGAGYIHCLIFFYSPRRAPVIGSSERESAGQPEISLIRAKSRHGGSDPVVEVNAYKGDANSPKSQLTKGHTKRQRGMPAVGIWPGKWKEGSRSGGKLTRFSLEQELFAADPNRVITEQTLCLTEPTLGLTELTLGATERTLGVTEPTLGVTEQTLGATEQTLGATEQTLGATEQTLGVTEQTLGATE